MDTSIIPIGDRCKQCAGVWLDTGKNVYMSESGTHSILKYSSTTNTTICIYIADGDNNRIERWLNNAKNGTTIAGGKGSFLSFLNCQTNISLSNIFSDSGKTNEQLSTLNSKLSSHFQSNMQ